jgi:uncharacterized protein
MEKFVRKQAQILARRIEENPSQIIFIAGPRQVGKTTLIKDTLAQLPSNRYRFVATDRPSDQSNTLLAESAVIETTEDVSAFKDVKWLVRVWQEARVEAAQREKEISKANTDEILHAEKNEGAYVLVIDEIQKIPDWSEAVKGLWDQDRAKDLKLHIVLLGSSPLLIQKGMSESLMGRIEIIRLGHWSFIEMNLAFGYTLNEYIYFGGYPGLARFIREESRWRVNVRDSMIDPSIKNDVLKMTRIDKPALLKQLFELSSSYSGQVVAYEKLRGELLDAGNTTTLAGYLDCLGDAGLIVGMQKYASQPLRRRSTPKLIVLNTAFMAVESGYTFDQAQADRSFWGRMTESAVGAHILNDGNSEIESFYWRESSTEVDFVLKRGKQLVVIEVKSGAKRASSNGLEKFEENFGKCRKLIVGNGGTSIAEFLSRPIQEWFDDE